MLRHPSSGQRPSSPLRLYGRRVVLRPLAPGDFPAWSEVRRRNEAWLAPWEPRRPPQQLDPTVNRDAFVARCAARDRDVAAGLAYGFGVYVDQELAGEVNLNHVLRGAMQSATVGYWIDHRAAGRSLIAESVVVVSTCPWTRCPPSAVSGVAAHSRFTCEPRARRPSVVRERVSGTTSHANERSSRAATVRQTPDTLTLSSIASRSMTPWHPTSRRVPDAVGATWRTVPISSTIPVNTY